MIWDPPENVWLLDLASDNAEKSVASGASRQCDEAGENVTFLDTKQSALVKLNFSLNAKDIMLRYRQIGTRTPTLSVSPDLKSVAYDASTVSLEQPATADIRAIPLSGDNGQRVGAIRWKADLSSLFYIVEDRSSRVESMRIMDINKGETSAIRLPSGFEFWDGGFLDGDRGFLLFMRRPLSAEGPRPGTVFVCAGGSAGCRPVLGSVDEFSMNERGYFGAVTLSYRDPRVRYASDSFVFPDKYVVRIMNADGFPIIRQEFPGRLTTAMKVHVSPSNGLLINWETVCQMANSICWSIEVVEFSDNPGSSTHRKRH